MIKNRVLFFIYYIIRNILRDVKRIKVRNAFSWRFLIKPGWWMWVVIIVMIVQIVVYYYVSWHLMVLITYFWLWKEYNRGKWKHEWRQQWKELARETINGGESDEKENY